ncbi:MAG TPA: hypothetical protein VEB86_10835 [Chryseosolibacter sp.]|nr:hypothetical protein [Chryseosolibacter sp.]
MLDGRDLSLVLPDVADLRFGFGLGRLIGASNERSNKGPRCGVGCDSSILIFRNFFRTVFFCASDSLVCGLPDFETDFFFGAARFFTGFFREVDFAFEAFFAIRINLLNATLKIGDYSILKDCRGIDLNKTVIAMERRGGKDERVAKRTPGGPRGARSQINRQEACASYI